MLKLVRIALGAALILIAWFYVFEPTIQDMRCTQAGHDAEQAGISPAFTSSIVMACRIQARMPR